MVGSTRLPSRFTRRWALMALSAAGSQIVSGVALAQGARRTARIVVPFTAGSGSDSAARFFGEKLGPLIDQSVIVENKPGGNGLITIQAVKSAPPDGSTILLGNISLMAINPVVLKNPGYDPLGDFQPLSGLYRGPAIYCVPLESPYKTLEDLVVASRKTPVAMGNYSQGYQLAVDYLAKLASAKFVHVPYKGQAPLMADLMGNQVEAALLDFGGAVTTLKANKLRPLAITSDARHPAFPNVPTVRESGFGEYVHYSWVGLFVRRETPVQLTERMTEALQQILKTPDAQKFADSISGELMPLRPAEMRQFVTAEYERFRKVAAAAGIVPQ
ncbi:MAG: tripartite tricarboxylate transporter substrate binding protein [Comamonadaceae bacterium]|nr:tripartite tricarboxylate transporter substrate binding protein [Comamonadaceae bacterium]